MQIQRFAMVEQVLKFKIGVLWIWGKKEVKKSVLVKHLVSLGFKRPTAYRLLEKLPKVIGKADALKALHPYME